MLTTLLKRLWNASSASRHKAERTYSPPKDTAPFTTSIADVEELDDLIPPNQGKESTLGLYKGKWETNDQLGKHIFAPYQDIHRTVLCKKAEDGDPIAMGLLGRELAKEGSLDDATIWIERAVLLHPIPALIWCDLGNIRRLQGRPEEAEESYGNALRHDSNFTLAHLNQANLFLAKGDHAASEHALKAAISSNPNHIGAYAQLADMLYRQNRIEDATEILKRALNTQPDNIDLINALVTITHSLKNYSDLIEPLMTALNLRPDDGKLHFLCGLTYHQLKDFEQASDHYLFAMHHAPDDSSYVSAAFNQGHVYKELWLLSDAANSYEAAIERQPSFAAAHANLGLVRQKQGLIEEAISDHRVALSYNMKASIYRSYLTCLLYSPDYSLDEMFYEACTFGSIFTEGIQPLAPRLQSSEDRNRRIRVGYLSSDFKNHPVGRNLLPILQTHDRNQFEIHLFAHFEKPDSYTDRIKSLAENWHPIFGLTDAVVAHKVREEKIDILVSLAGRFDHNRPLVLAYKAAPIQVSYHDPATSGLDAVDYLITDITLSPRNSREQFVEKLIRLPSFYAHDPLEKAPELSSPPINKSGTIMFGSFNNPAKISPTVIALWSRVLKAIPDSNLLLKYRENYNDPKTRARVITLFQQEGVDTSRIGFGERHLDMGDHLSAYSQIDIALDTFPFTGATTTFEALWMGVPVVTLAGETMLSRWSASILRQAEHAELIADTPNAFVEIAQGLASDPKRLNHLRHALRKQVAQSSICNNKVKTRHLERAFLFMWRKWLSPEPKQKAS